MDPSAARTLASRYVWWQPPEETLTDVPVLLRQILRLGTPSDYAAAVALWGRDALRDALVTAPPGSLDEPALRRAMPCLAKAIVLHRAPNTLDCSVPFSTGEVMLSFFGGLG